MQLLLSKCCLLLLSGSASSSSDHSWLSCLFFILILESVDGQSQDRLGYGWVTTASPSPPSQWVNTSKLCRSYYTFSVCRGQCVCVLGVGVLAGGGRGAVPIFGHPRPRLQSSAVVLECWQLQLQREGEWWISTSGNFHQFPAETYISSFHTSLARESRMASHHVEGMGRVRFALCLGGQ